MAAAASPSRDRARIAQARQATPRELGVGEGLRLRGLPCSWIRRPAATRRGAGRPRRWVSASRTREGSTRFPSASWWRAWTHGGGSEEAARPGPSARSHCAPATRVPFAPEVRGSLRPCLSLGFAGPGAASGCGNELFPRRRRLCVLLGAPRVGRCLAARSSCRAGRGRALPAPREKGGTGTAGGPPPPRGLGFRTPDSIERRRRKGQSCPTPSPPCRSFSQRLARWTPAER